MEGIASASAVVSLSVQLIITTRDVVKFLREIQDSPEELRSTIEFLEQLWGSFKLIKVLVDEQSAYVDLSSSLVSIRNALKICESKIRLVESRVNKFKGVLDRQSSVRMKWSSLKHVLKKGEIKNLQDHLRDATTNLHLAVAINTAGVILRNKQAGVIDPENLLVASNKYQLFAQNVSMPCKNEDIRGLGLRSTNVATRKITRALDSPLGVPTSQGAILDPGSISVSSERWSSLTRPSSLQSEDKELRMCSPAIPPQSRIIFKERMPFWYMGIFGSVIVHRRSKSINDSLNAHIFDKRIVSEQRIIVLRPSFLKTQFELHALNSCGRISRTLRMDCVVDYKASVFDLCRSGDIEGLRDAFNRGGVSLDAVNPLGMGLLHYAAGSFQKDLCSWLLNMGVGADRTTILGHTALAWMGARSRMDQSSAVTETMIEIARLLIGAQKDLSDFDISKWFYEYDGPPEGAELILSQEFAYFYIRLRDDADPIYPALASILRLYAKNPERWESIVRMLIRNGADVHAPVRRKLTILDQSQYIKPVRTYGTPLDELFKYTIDPFEGQVAAHGWLQILASEGHDIRAYLEKEWAWHEEPMQLTIPSSPTMGYENERRLVFDWEASPTVSWDWWINPSSSTFILREEFRLMVANPPPDDILIQMSWKEAWPVRYPAWSEYHQYYGDMASIRRSTKMLNRANERAAKRAENKAQKMARARRYRGPCQVPPCQVPKIPGAWPI